MSPVLFRFQIQCPYRVTNCWTRNCDAPAAATVLHKRAPGKTIPSDPAWYECKHWYAQVSGRRVVLRNIAQSCRRSRKPLDSIVQSNIIG